MCLMLVRQIGEPRYSYSRISDAVNLTGRGDAVVLATFTVTGEV